MAYETYGSVRIVTGRVLITTIPQVGGGVRELYAATATDAAAAKALIRRDRSMIDHLEELVCGHIDIDGEGSRRWYPSRGRS